MARNSPAMASGYLSAYLSGSRNYQEVRLTPMKTTFSPGKVLTFYADIPFQSELISQVRIKYDRGGPYDAQGIMINRLTLQQTYGSRVRRSYCGAHNQLITAGYYYPLYSCY